MGAQMLTEEDVLTSILREPKSDTHVVVLMLRISWYGINQIKLTLDDCNWKHWMEAQKQLQKMIRMEKITSEASEISNTWRRWLGWQGGSFESFSTWTSPSPVGERKDHGRDGRQRQGRVSKGGEQSYKWNRQTKKYEIPLIFDFDPSDTNSLAKSKLMGSFTSLALFSPLTRALKTPLLTPSTSVTMARAPIAMGTTNKA